MSRSSARGGEALDRVPARRARGAPARPVRYFFSKPRRDGKDHLELSPVDFLARLAALIIPSRVHLVTYFERAAGGPVTFREVSHLIS